MPKKISRRKFIEMGALGAAGMSLANKTGAKRGRVSAENTIRLGIIGTGDRGAWESYILKQTPGIDVVACCDILPGHLQDGLKHAVKGAAGYSDYRKLLEHKNLDAVLIATPQYLHHDMVLDTLDADKHIICEKTLTMNIAEALSLSRAVKQSDKVFQVAYQWQSSPLFNRIHEMVQNGVCGQIIHIRCNYNRNGDWRVKVNDPNLERLLNWRMYREYSGGLMAELCSHHINIVNWLLGKLPQKVMGFGSIDYWKDGRETYDNVNTIFEYPGGAKASLQAITTNAFEDVSIVVMGTEGTITIGNEEGQVAHIYTERRKIESALNAEELKELDAIANPTRRSWARGEAIPIEVENNTKDDLETTRAMFLDFAQCVREGGTPRSNVDNGRQVAIAVDMANTAMRNGTIETWKTEYLN